MPLHLSPEATLALAKTTMHDRIIGALFGSALGDAIGLYTEFLSERMSALAYPSRKFTLVPPEDATPFRRDAHRKLHEPGEWTDDTDHAMLIVLAYLHDDGKESNPRELASRLSIWCRYGLTALGTLPMGLGKTVGAVVRSEKYLDDPEGAARRHWKTGGYHAAPNGSLMRTHPLGPICLHKTVKETFHIAAAHSVITHTDPRCIISCAIGTALVRGIILGQVLRKEQIDETIDCALQWWRKYREQTPGDPDEPDLDLAELWRHAKVNCLEDLKLDDACTMGYVYKTFGAGIHLLRQAMRQFWPQEILCLQSNTFELLITDLIMYGGDADTNACFAGALLGAFFGYKALPLHWKGGLKHGNWLMKKSVALSSISQVLEESYSHMKDKDTAADGGWPWPTDAQMAKKTKILQMKVAKEEQDWQEQRRAEEKKRKGWLKWK